eukprot:CAMPEP_0118640820 /NCGR_PEP_ID=MMETSP0785-20121206/4953_1 /TAXON_ID=91992 /ORGANISM="Bolidomonas pacifica, Strain CCMP 1866" /LENGTH=300 /DNA_ID=CAMNT_0006532225 /DNA_START=139 /DNA_END=1038 /DNA_ORIENTATION=+
MRLSYLVFLSVFFKATADECTLSMALDDSNPCTLDDCSDAVLEECCLQRGFELARSSGVEFTHTEYVEAAKQCLELEAELNKLLEENPDLLAELEAEQAKLAGEGGEGGDVGDVGEVGEAGGVGETGKVPVEVSDVAVDDIVNSVAEDPVVEDATASSAAEDPVVEDAAASSPEDPTVEAASSTESAPRATVGDTIPSQSDDETPPEEVMDLDAEPESSLGNADNANLLNPAGLSMKELWDGFKAKVSSDANMVCDKVLPAPLRGPVKGAVKKAMTVTKTVIGTGVKTIKRTVTTFIDAQ